MYINTPEGRDKVSDILRTRPGRTFLKYVAETSTEETKTSDVWGDEEVVTFLDYMIERELSPFITFSYGFHSGKVCLALSHLISLRPAMV